MRSRTGMLPLVVSRITSQGAGIVAVELVDPAGAALPAWEPGAHVDLQLITRQERQYSLCGDPGDRRTYRIAVLREELSRGGSMYIHEHLRPGSPVRVRPPRNLFALRPADRHLLLAAGIGITPLLPMAARLHRDAEAGSGSWSGSWELHYSVSGDPVPFAAELDELGDAVTVHSSAGGTRVDLPLLLADPQPGTAVYACGPARFIEAVEEAMRHWPAGSLHLERFEPKPVPVRPNAAFTVTCARSNVTVEVPAERSMLAALTDHDLPVAGSCLRGVCGSCAVRVLGGRVEHRDSLTAGDEVQIIYPCVSRALGRELVVDL